MKGILDSIKKYFKANDEVLSFLAQQSVHQIKAVLKGRRELHDTATLKFLEVYQAILAEEKDNTFESEAYEEETYSEILEKKQRQVKYKLRNKKELLEKTKAKRSRWLIGLGVCERLKTSNLDTYEYALKWVEHRERNLKYLLNFEDTKAQIRLLEAEIAGLAAQLKILEEAI